MINPLSIRKFSSAQIKQHFQSSQNPANVHEKLFTTPNAQEPYELSDLARAAQSKSLFIEENNQLRPLIPDTLFAEEKRLSLQKHPLLDEVEAKKIDKQLEEIYAQMRAELIHSLLELSDDKNVQDFLLY